MAQRLLPNTGNIANRPGLHQPRDWRNTQRAGLRIEQEHLPLRRDGEHEQQIVVNRRLWTHSLEQFGWLFDMSPCPEH